MPWLKFFRVVNLPTVPGDVLVGAAVAAAFSPIGVNSGDFSQSTVFFAAAVAVFLYMFGLADNDIVGAAEDKDRPVSSGEISLGAAKAARGVVFVLAVALAAFARLSVAWWIAAFLLTISIVVYNRTKIPLLMGACRALNVFCGVAASGVQTVGGFSAGAVASAVWLAYATWITYMSNGEESDENLRRRVGFFIGAIIYLQLMAMLIFPVRDFLVAGAALLVVLRLSKAVFPKVSAS